MIYKNAELHNVAELIHNEDGSISWKRMPSYVHAAQEIESEVAYNCTGVEMRFVIKGDKAVIRMSAGEGRFHVYRGGIQGGWEDHERHKNVGKEIEEFVIERSKNMEHLKIMTEKSGYDWDCEVVRIIFDKGRFKIYDIIGDIEPPKKEQCPKRTLLAYGSSITHGSNAIDSSHTWVSVLAHNLNVDARNLGMAGSCAMEPEMVEYLASEGENGRWDFATLELGINVLDWEEEKICSRVDNIIRQVAGRNPEKPIFVISPFYYCGDDFDDSGNAAKWRRLIEQVVNKLQYPNVTYINGMDILGDMSYMCADEGHPNIYGVQKIADKLTELIKPAVCKGDL